MHASEHSIAATRPHPGHVPELDGLRAVACLLVILFHAAPSGLFAGGFLGVDMFFVLSGFLITNVLVTEWEDSKRIAIGQFYLQRALRLAPALLFFLAVYVVAAPLAWPGEPHFRDAGLTALYVSDYSYPLTGSPRYLQHSWSLSVEEQFYLLWPLVIPLVVQRHRGIILLFLAWLAITLGRYALANSGWVNYYYFLHTHSSGLIAGAGLALARRQGLVNIGARSGAIATFVFAMLTMTARMPSSTVAITLGEILSILIIGCIVSGSKLPFSTILAAKPMVGIGKLSYGLYLWHFPIAYYLRADFGFFVTASVTLGLALAGSILSYYTVEKWGRIAKARLKSRGTISATERPAPVAIPSALS